MDPQEPSRSFGALSENSERFTGDESQKRGGPAYISAMFGGCIEQQWLSLGTQKENCASVDNLCAR